MSKLRAAGYDKTLFLTNARKYVLSMHSETPVRLEKQRPDADLQAKAQLAWITACVGRAESKL